MNTKIDFQSDVGTLHFASLPNRFHELSALRNAYQRPKSNRNQQRLQLLLLGMLLLGATIGCGPKTVSQGSTSGSNSAASSAPVSLAAECGHDVANLSDLSLRIQTVRSSVADTSARARVRINRISDTFSDRAFSTLKFFSFSVDRNGTPSAPRPVYFFVESKATSGAFVPLLNGDWMEDITVEQMVAAGKEAGSTGTTAKSVLDRLVFHVHFDDPNAQVLAAATYNGTETAVAQLVETLRPPFVSSPVEFASTRPARLANLHPLQGMASGAWSREQFQSESTRFCF